MIFVRASLLAGLLALVGCGAPPGPPVVRSTSIVAAPWANGTTGLVLAPGLEAQRSAIIAHLRQQGYLAANELPAEDLAHADRLIRVASRPGGGYAVTVFHPGFAATAASPRVDPGVPLFLEPDPRYPIFPRSYRRYPFYPDPLHRDPLHDALWPRSPFDFHYPRDYLHPSPLYPRYYRPTPPPVIVRPLDPPPLRPRSYDPAEGITPREPPPPPQPRRDYPEPRHDFPRPPR
jgi:hypothetical protein